MNDELPTTGRPAGSPPASPGSDDRDEDGDLEKLPLTVIDAATGWQALDLRQLWQYRELLYFFTWRDVKVRYKQTELGAAWAVIQPLATTGVFAVLFGLLMGRGREPGVPGIPYVLSTFCAMLPWQLFAESLVRSSESLVEGQSLITKVYFPRVILPLAAVMTGLVDFAITAVVLLAMMVWYGVAPSWGVLTLPLFVLLAMAASLGVGLWLAALSAIYRDFRYVRPFLVSLGMYVSPVIYATANLKGVLPDWAILIYGLNPMVGVIEGFRWALLGTADPPGMVLLPSVLTAVVLLVAGVRFFHRMERTIVDVI
jgi:lipopolysaccharide transport system permease protein